MFGKKVLGQFIGGRDTYADIAQTIAAYFDLEGFENAKSFL